MVSRRQFLATVVFSSAILLTSDVDALSVPQNLEFHPPGPVWKPLPKNLLIFFQGQAKRVDMTQFVTGAVGPLVLIGPPLPQGISFDGAAFSYDGLGPIAPLNAPQGWTLQASDGVLVASKKIFSRESAS